MRTFLVSVLLNFLATVPATLRLRWLSDRHDDAPDWWMQASRIFPYRYALKTMRIILPMCWSIFAYVLHLFPPSPFDEATAWAAFAGAWLGATLAYLWSELRLMQPPHPVRAAVVQTIIDPAWLFLYIVTVMLVMPSRFGAGCALALLTASGLLLWLWMLGGWLWVLRRIKLIRPAGGRLTNLADALLSRLNLENARLFEMPMIQANAFASPLHKQIAFTEAALERLNDTELQAILAHEAGHLKEGWRTSIKRMSVYIPLIPVLAALPIISTYGFPTFVFSIVAAYAIVILLGAYTRREARRLEEQADSIAHHESDEGVYAKSLEKIYRINRVPPVIGARGLRHPELYDRMVSAGVTPPYARPLSPPRWISLLLVIFAVLILSAGFLIQVLLNN